MYPPHSRFRGLLALAILGLTAHAQSLLTPTPLPLTSLGEFQPGPTNWSLAGGLGGNPRVEKRLNPLPGTGVLINTPTAAAHADLVTTWNHGDLDLDLDFLMPVGGTLGVLLQGRYPVPLGAAALRAPGLWQHLHVEFRGPTYLDSANGPRSARAIFQKIVLNDFLVAEKIEATSLAALTDAVERSSGPLVITGTNPVAIRVLAWKRLGYDYLRGFDFRFKVYAGEFRQIGDYDQQTPSAEGPLSSREIAAALGDRAGKFALAATGSFEVKRAGLYLFSAETNDMVRLEIDDQLVLVPMPKGSEPASLTLTAGNHRFRVDQLHSSNSRPALRIVAEGPDLGPAPLLAPYGSGRTSRPTPPQLLIEPGERIRLQRGFVPFEPRKKLYAINVGTPAGVHYAYDFETGALLRVWRGNFLDVYEMWHERGENQFSKPAGPALTLNAKPTVALLESTAHDWPEMPEALWSSQGYTLEPDGQPVFLAKLSTLAIRDRIAPAADGRGLTRTLNIKGQKTDWQTWVLIAEANTITRQPDGRGYIVGDHTYYIDLPADSALQPVVRTRHGSQQLVVPINGARVDATLVYTLVW